ncbi:MAG: class D beta-lactamase [Verrucomicrobia bacterium]|nr:class D beta-lactamase [Verrucomicrobiota bacterium]
MSCLSFSRLISSCLFIACYIHAFSAEENFFLINGITDEVITELGPNLNKQISPCSTFKIPLSLMGYDASVLKDETNPVWDFQEGYDDWLISWKTSQSPLSWMKYSCIWYSKVLSIELGLDKLQNCLTSMEYGNQDASEGLINPGPLDPFWINSSLKISPKEQVVFIQKMIRGHLSISSNAIEMTKAILFKEDLPEGWKLFGKTGWSGSDITKDGYTLEHSWFVGWIEKDHSFYPFAYLIRDKKINLDQRIPRVKELLIMNQSSFE